jgi:catechol 2,3-dioxygenase
LHAVAYANFSGVLTAANTIPDPDLAHSVRPGKLGVSQSTCLYVNELRSDHRVEIYAGGDRIFDPDWQVIK